MISPLDIRQHSFSKALRGFDADEVKAFLLSLSAEWEKLQDENRQLRTSLEEARASLKGYQEVESMLHKTLLQAEQSSQSVVENARKEAELKLRAADQQVQGMLAQINEEKLKLEQETKELTRRKTEIIGQLGVFLQGQLERLRSFENPLHENKTNGNRWAAESFFDRALGQPSPSDLINDLVSKL